MITVETPTPSAFYIKQEAVFFTTSWIHGSGIAEREVGHPEKNSEDPVAAEVQALPDTYLKTRLASAQLAVAAEVVEVRTIPGQVPERRAHAEQLNAEESRRAAVTSAVNRVLRTV